MESLYRRHRFPPEIINHAVWLYHRFTLNFRDGEDLLAERGVTVFYEAIRSWRRKFGPAYACTLRRRQGRLGDIWHVDEGFITIRGERHYLWRAVDQDGDVLDILVTRHRDRRATKRFFRKVLKHQGSPPWQLVTDKLSSYPAAHREVFPSVTHRTASTRTTELKFPTNTPGSRNAKCVDSNQRHNSNAFSASTARFTICSELDVIISKRSIIACSGSELSRTGRRRLVLAEERRSERASGQNRLGLINLTMPPRERSDYEGTSISRRLCRV